MFKLPHRITDTRVDTRHEVSIFLGETLDVRVVVTRDDENYCTHVFGILFTKVQSHLGVQTRLRPNHESAFDHRLYKNILKIQALFFFFLVGRHKKKKIVGWILDDKIVLESIFLKI